MPTPETGHWLGTVKVGMGGLVPCLWQVNKGWGLLWFWDQVGSAGKEAVGVDSDTEWRSARAQRDLGTQGLP